MATQYQLSWVPPGLGYPPFVTSYGLFLFLNVSLFLPNAMSKVAMVGFCECGLPLKWQGLSTYYVFFWRALSHPFRAVRSRFQCHILAILLQNALFILFGPCPSRMAFSMECRYALRKVSDRTSANISPWTLPAEVRPSCS